MRPLYLGAMIFLIFLLAAAVLCCQSQPLLLPPSTGISSLASSPATHSGPATIRAARHHQQQQQQQKPRRVYARHYCLQHITKAACGKDKSPWGCSACACKWLENGGKEGVQAHGKKAEHACSPQLVSNQLCEDCLHKTQVVLGEMI